MTYDELLVMLDDLTELWQSDRPPATSRARISEAYLPEVFGLTSHAVTLARSVGVLMRSGEPLGAIPLIRGIIECAVRAVWLRTYRELLPAVIHEDARQVKNTVKLAAKLDPLKDEFPSLAQATSTLEQTRLDRSDSARIFEKMCTDFAGGERVYLIYRIASAYVHPSFLMIDTYLEEVERTADNSAGLILQTQPTFDNSESWLGIAVNFLIHAMVAFDQVDYGHRLRSPLKQAARDFGVGTTWHQSPQGFSNHTRMTKERRDRRREARRKQPERTDSPE